MLFASIAGEISTRPVLDCARAAGRRLLWPRVNPQGELEFAACPGWEALRPGRYGVLEPPAELAAEPLGPDVLVLVPGLAFDRTGGRLGRGGGHYDRALARRRGARSFGTGFAFQVVEELPLEPWDARVDALLTEEGILRVAAGQTGEPT